jgi:hypothetical protein
LYHLAIVEQSEIKESKEHSFQEPRVCAEFTLKALLEMEVDTSVISGVKARPWALEKYDANFWLL